MGSLEVDLVGGQAESLRSTEAKPPLSRIPLDGPVSTLLGRRPFLFAVAASRKELCGVGNGEVLTPQVKTFPSRKKKNVGEAR